MQEHKDGIAPLGFLSCVASGRRLVESDLTPAGGIVGTGVEECRWPRPVRPGDELRVESEVLEVRPSQSRPDQGLLKVRTTTLNQHGDAVQVLIGTFMIPRRVPQGT